MSQKSVYGVAFAWLVFFVFSFLSSCRIQLVDPDGNPISKVRQSSRLALSSGMNWSQWALSSSSRSQPDEETAPIGSSCKYVTYITNSPLYSWIRVKANQQIDTVYSETNTFPGQTIPLTVFPTFFSASPNPINSENSISHTSPPISVFYSQESICPGDPRYDIVEDGQIFYANNDTIRINYGPSPISNVTQFTVSILNKEELIAALDTLDLRQPWIAKPLSIAYYSNEDAVQVSVKSPSQAYLFPGRPSQNVVDLDFSNMFNPCSSGFAQWRKPIVPTTLSDTTQFYHVILYAAADTKPNSSFSWEIWVRNRWGYKDMVRINTYITEAPPCEAPYSDSISDTILVYSPYILNTHSTNRSRSLI